MWNLDIRQSFTRFRHLLPVALLVVLVAAVGLACIPTLLFTLDDPSPDASNCFGHSLAVGDVNGDGKADIAVAAIEECVGTNQGHGPVYVFSGANGSLLFALDTPNPQPYGFFGVSVAMGDVDGDGRDDIAVGAIGERVGTNQGQGRVYVFSGVSGSLLLTLTVRSPNPELPRSFGESLAVGDVNGDGKGDIAVGVPWEPVGGHQQGRAYVFSGANGSLLFALDTPNPQPSGGFGYSVAMGDVDGDGKADIAVGANEEDVGGNTDQRRAYVFSGADGSLLFTLDSPNQQAGADFGGDVAVGDVNGDGMGEIVVGAPGEDVGANVRQGGRAYVFSGLSGSVLLTLTAPNPQSYGGFGSAVATGDVNGDSKADVAVGAPATTALYFGSSAAASAYVFSGASGSLLFIIPNFGSSLAVGDTNGDGMAEMAVADYSPGRVYVYSPVPPPPPPATATPSGGVGTQIVALATGEGAETDVGLPWTIIWLAVAGAAGVVAGLGGYRLWSGKTGDH